MNIHVSNLDAVLTNDDLRSLFSAHGEVASAEIAIDAFTDKPRGFGYVEMTDDAQAKAAIAALDQKEVNGRSISVKETEPKQVRRGSYKVGDGSVNVYRFRKN
jgi:RNA recognition motif-containing protein